MMVITNKSIYQRWVYWVYKGSPPVYNTYHTLGFRNMSDILKDAHYDC